MKIVTHIGPKRAAIFITYQIIYLIGTNFLIPKYSNSRYSLYSKGNGPEWNHVPFLFPRCWWCSQVFFKCGTCVYIRRVPILVAVAVESVYMYLIFSGYVDLLKYINDSQKRTLRSVTPDEMKLFEKYSKFGQLFTKCLLGSGLFCLLLLNIEVAYGFWVGKVFTVDNVI